MHIFKCYALSSPEINKRPFLFYCKERKGRERIQYMSEREREREREKRKCKKKERKKTEQRK